MHPVINSRCNEVAQSRRPYVTEQVEDIDQMISRLEAVYSDLSRKLEPIVRPEMPVPTSSVKEICNRAEIPPLAERLTTYYNRLRNMTEDMENLCSRVEL